jgi:general stress protein 26
MLTTVDADGGLHSRPMSNNRDVEFDGDLWFFIEGSSAKVAEISANPEVSAGFADIDGRRYAALSGTASIVRDRAKIEELWKPILKAWFPDGPATADLALLKVEARHGEYWDASAPLIAQAVSFARALLTGKEASYGENEKVEL